MSIFLPYNPQLCVETFVRWFNLSLVDLTDFELLCICLLANILFYIFWGFVMYFVIKGFNKIYERIF